jgi:hypothetical protein
MQIITQNFVAAGKPYYIRANAGVLYLDITDGKRYRQRTIPYGQSWVEIQDEQVFIPASGGGTVTSVGLSVTAVGPSAFSVSGSPVTTNGTLQITLAGNAGEYIRGDGSLATFPAVPATYVSTFSAGSTGLTPVAATSGAVTLAGTLGVGNGGTGVTTTPSNGQLLIGNGTGYTVATLTPGTGIGVANGVGTITVSNTDRGSSQNIFKNIAVPTQVTITANTNNDTLNVVPGTGITITTTPGTDTITISNSAPAVTYTGRQADVYIDSNNEISTVATFSGFLLMGG